MCLRISSYTNTSNTYCFRTWRWIALFGGTCVVFFLKTCFILQKHYNSMILYTKTIIMQSNKPNHIHNCEHDNVLTSNSHWCPWTILYIFTSDKLFSPFNTFFFIFLYESIHFTCKHVLSISDVLSLWCRTGRLKIWNVLQNRATLRHNFRFTLLVTTTQRIVK